MPAPSGTTLRFLLLVAMTALAAGFAGDWMFLSTRTSQDVVPPWGWLVGPPALVLCAAAALTLAAPRWLERRRGWVPVPADRGAAALARYDDLVAAAGLPTAPRLVWNPEEDLGRARSYGRPGRYRIAISPALLGAARRHPAAYDAVLRHELAHVRHRDVAPAYFAILAWYVLVTVLSLPLLWRVVDRDLSLVPEYLLRAGLLAVVVYWVRADLLRTREHYADVRSADTAEHREALVRTLGVPARTTWWREGYALHPTTASRVRVIAEPRLLGRMGFGEFLAVGLTATYAVPLLGELLFYSGLSALAAPEAAWRVLFGLVGAYAGAAAARRAGSGAADRAPVGALAGLTLGLSVGAPLSLGMTGLAAFASAQLLASALTALVFAGYLAWATDLGEVLAAGIRRPRVVAAVGAAITGVVFSVLAGVVFAAAELIGARLGDLVVREPFRSLTSTTSAVVLAWLVLPLGLATLGFGAGRARRARGVLGTALSAGATATLVSWAVRSRVDLDGDEATWHYVVTVTWVAVGAAVLAACWTAAGRGAGRLTGGLAAAGLTALLAWAGLGLYENLLFGGTMPAGDVLSVGGDVAAVALALAALPAALVRLIAEAAGQHGTGRARLAVGALGLVAAVATTSLVPETFPDSPRPGVDQPATVPELARYLEEVVPAVEGLRLEANTDYQEALTLGPRADARIRELVLPQYDEMLVLLDQQRPSDAATARVHDALRQLVVAERALYLAQVRLADDQASRDAFTDALAAQDQALAAWVSVRSAAGEHGS